MSTRQPRRIDFTGRQFGSLTVESFAGLTPHGMARWLCRCQCGATKTARADGLLNGETKCDVCNPTGFGQKKHGWTGTPTYSIWRGVVARCCRPSSTSYPRYGAIGVTICDRWRHSFENFLADMGERPPGFTIERIRADGNYEPGNCRWATVLEQANNKRNTRWITINGETDTAANWERRLNMPRGNLIGRLRKGWSIEDAASIPVGRGCDRHRRARTE